jgi:hypothetical protein
VGATAVTVRVTPLDGPLDLDGLQVATAAYGSFVELPATLVLEG